MKRFFIGFLNDGSIHVHFGIGKEYRDERNRIKEENITVREIVQKKSGKQRAHYSGDIEIGRVQTDCTMKCFFSYQFRHESHAGRHIEGIDRSQKKGKE